MGGHNKKHSKNKNSNKANINSEERKKSSTKNDLTTSNNGAYSVQEKGVRSKRPLISPEKRNELSKHIDTLKRLTFKTPKNSVEEWDLYKQIQEVLKKVQTIEEPLKPFKEPISASKRLEKIDAFYKWSKENDLYFDGVEISEYPGFGLGLKASKDIEAEKLLFSVPKKLIFTEKTVSENVLEIHNMSNVNLTCALMLEFVQQNSFWRPYLDMFPSEYNTCLYYTEKDMEMLKGTTVLPAVLRQCTAIARQYALSYNLINNLNPDAGARPSAILLKEKLCYSLYR